MSDTAQGRPRQLTMATWFVIVGSAFLVLAAFDRISTLNSVDTREDVERVLGSGSGDGLGLGLDQALMLMRAGLTVAAVCAAAAVVLGVFALQRHRGARIGLTVLAVPLLFTSPLTGGLMGALVAAGVAMMWTGPARDWFAGRAVRETPTWSWTGLGSGRTSSPPEDRARETPEPPQAPDSPPAGPPSAPSTPPSGFSTGAPSSAPAPVSGFGTAPVAAPVLGRPDQRGPVPPYGRGLAPGGRPVGVRVACLLTWGFAGVVALMYAALLVVLLVDSDFLVDEVVASPAWKQAGFDRDLLVPVLWLGCVMFLAWSGSAMVLAWFAWRRHNWARYLLIASAAAAIIAASFAFPFGLPHQVASALAIAGLLNAPARRWFAGGQQPGPPAPQQPGPPDQQPRPPVW